jgi:hypothetical protein
MMPTLTLIDQVQAVRRLVLITIALQLLGTLTFAAYFTLKDKNAELRRSLDISVTLGPKHATPTHGTTEEDATIPCE